MIPPLLEILTPTSVPHQLIMYFTIFPMLSSREMFSKAADFASLAYLRITLRSYISKFRNIVPKIIRIIAHNSQSTISAQETIAVSLELGYADIDSESEDIKNNRMIFWSY